MFEKQPQTTEDFVSQIAGSNMAQSRYMTQTQLRDWRNELILTAQYLDVANKIHASRARKGYAPLPTAPVSQDAANLRKALEGLWRIDARARGVLQTSDYVPAHDVIDMVAAIMKEVSGYKWEPAQDATPRPDHYNVTKGIAGYETRPNVVDELVNKVLDTTAPTADRVAAAKIVVEASESAKHEPPKRDDRADAFAYLFDSLKRWDHAQMKWPFGFSFDAMVTDPPFNSYMELNLDKPAEPIKFYRKGDDGKVAEITAEEFFSKKPKESPKQEAKTSGPVEDKPTKLNVLTSLSHVALNKEEYTDAVIKEAKERAEHELQHFQGKMSKDDDSYFGAIAFLLTVVRDDRESPLRRIVYDRTEIAARKILTQWRAKAGIRD